MERIGCLINTCFAEQREKTVPVRTRAVISRSLRSLCFKLSGAINSYIGHIINDHLTAGETDQTLSRYQRISSVKSQSCSKSSTCQATAP